MTEYTAIGPGPGTGHIAERIAVHAFQQALEAAGGSASAERIAWAGGHTPNHDFAVTLPFADRQDRTLSVQVKSVSRKRLTLIPHPSQPATALTGGAGSVEVIEGLFRRPNDYSPTARGAKNREFSDLWCFVSTSGSGKRTKAESTLTIGDDGAITIREETTIHPPAASAEGPVLYWAPVCVLDDLFHYTLKQDGGQRAPKASGNEVSAPLDDPRLHRLDVLRGEVLPLADIEAACPHLPHHWRVTEPRTCP